jgi:hypothetical protein
MPRLWKQQYPFLQYRLFPQALRSLRSLTMAHVNNVCCNTFSQSLVFPSPCHFLATRVADFHSRVSQQIYLVLALEDSDSQSFILCLSLSHRTKKDRFSCLPSFPLPGKWLWWRDEYLWRLHPEKDFFWLAEEPCQKLEIRFGAVCVVVVVSVLWAMWIMSHR